MTRISSHELSLSVPQGWDARIYRRRAEPGTTTHPVVHAASMPLPEDRADFGSGAVELLGPDDIFVALIEFHPDAAGTATFDSDGWPDRLDPEWFDPAGLQRMLPGQAGFQRFFSYKGQRAFCLYVVLGSYSRRRVLAPRADALLAGLQVGS